MPAVFISAAVTATAQQLPGWALGPFVRPAGVNPIIVPNAQTLFFDPMSRKNLAWEAGDVFNPAAVVKNNKVCVLYRAEDESGKGIGKRTSRLGLAESKDGIVMKKSPKPVFILMTTGKKKMSGRVAVKIHVSPLLQRDCM
ncbi:glycoside hydrolase family protein [Niabella hibiscisoli]|uniref:hypothetical protein n=1 Tax=Niabella hibiscisoli TaxID=1825928 RepID=UPI001F0D8D5F|nr:hypothetical protein [Niabella hibiscisoli]MCH5718531.1 hypothetical protein [Niabella hibiscisoli]